MPEKQHDNHSIGLLHISKVAFTHCNQLGQPVGTTSIGFHGFMRMSSESFTELLS